MADMKVKINGHLYSISCGEGEEKKLRMLAQELDERVSSLKQSFGNVGESRLLVIASLLLIDELKESENKKISLERNMQLAEQASLTAQNLQADSEKNSLRLMERIAMSLENIAPKTE